MAKRRRKSKRRRNSMLILVMLLGLTGGAGIVLWERYGHERWADWVDNDPKYYGVHGIDVSRYQGKIDWEEVKKGGVSFAFIKATEGKTLIDRKFSHNWERSRRHGVLRGAYHFYRPSVLSEEQARFFLENVDMQPGDLPPVLDLEVTDGRSGEIIRKGVLNWMQIVERETGVRPILYTMPGFANDYLGHELKDYPLWVASLRRRKPRTPRGWKKWHFWQHTHHGQVRGVVGAVDRNYFYGTETELRGMCIPVATP